MVMATKESQYIYIYIDLQNPREGTDILLS